MPWDSKNPDPVGHDDMFPLTEDPKTCFLECANCIQVIDARYLWHESACNLDLSDHGISQKFVACCEIFLDCLLDVG